MGKNSIKCLFKRKSDRLIREEITASRWKSFVISASCVSVIIALILMITFFFSNKRTEYTDAVAEQRITNSSREMVKYINSRYAYLDNAFEFFKLDVEEEVNSTNDSTRLSSILKKHDDKVITDQYSGIHYAFLTDNGFDFGTKIKIDLEYNDVKYLLNEPNNKLVFFTSNYFVFLESLGDLSKGIKGVGMFIPNDLIENAIVTSIYNKKCAIILLDEEGDIAGVSCYGEGHSRDNVYTVEEIANERTNILSGNEGVAEFTYYDTRYEYYHTQGPIDNYYVMVVVPKLELVSQIEKLSNIGIHLLYSVLIVLAFLVIFMSVKISKQIANNIYSDSIDPKTGLLKISRFKHDIVALMKPSNSNYAIVYLDINHFKVINELYGSQNADIILERLGKTIKSKLSEDEFASYLNSDHFAILINGDNEAQVRGRLQSFNDSLKYFTYMDLEGLSLSMGVNVINYYADMDIQIEIDRAKYARDSINKNSYNNDNIVFYNETMYEQELEKADLEKRAPQAVKNKEFEVFFQLKRNIKDDTWYGSEALVRWRDKDNSLISPGKFIPLFESNGFITELDLYVFENVCERLREALDDGSKIVPVSVNLSKRHFHDLKFLEKFEAVVDKYEIPHELIEFEITEGLVIDNIQIFKEFISYVHDNGYSCAMDDFGSGYSSFNVIRELEFDTIKLDGKFFRGSNGFDNESKTIVESLIVLCHKLGKIVVAEGVEDKEQVDFLKEKGCDVIQGFYYAKPVPWNDYNEKLEKE